MQEDSIARYIGPGGLAEHDIKIVLNARAKPKRIKNKYEKE